MNISKKASASAAVKLRDAWMKQFEAYKKEFPELADRSAQNAVPPACRMAGTRTFRPSRPDAKGVASRDSSGKVINVMAKNVPWLMGGAADLHPSTKTRLTFDGAGEFEAASHGGRNMHFGIREHAMAAIANGIVAVQDSPVCLHVFYFYRLLQAGHPP